MLTWSSFLAMDDLRWVSRCTGHRHIVSGSGNLLHGCCSWLMWRPQATSVPSCHEFRPGKVRLAGLFRQHIEVAITVPYGHPGA